MVARRKEGASTCACARICEQSKSKAASRPASVDYFFVMSRHASPIQWQLKRRTHELGTLASAQSAIGWLGAFPGGLGLWDGLGLGGAILGV